MTGYQIFLKKFYNGQQGPVLGFEEVSRSERANFGVFEYGANLPIEFSGRVGFII